MNITSDRVTGARRVSRIPLVYSHVSLAILKNHAAIQKRIFCDCNRCHGRVLVAQYQRVVMAHRREYSQFRQELDGENAPLDSPAPSPASSRSGKVLTDSPASVLRTPLASIINSRMDQDMT
jgi:hypothetical protein